jgi:tagatose-6-phosphate ketose/aldose isomerase
VHTEKEIWNQPTLWEKIYELILLDKQSIMTFMESATIHKNLNVVLTGAGSSAFIGLSLQGSYRKNFKKHTTAISTTDIVTHPLDSLNSDEPLLLISFARSGNSPESIATTQFADQICSKVYHFIITCDASGALAKYETDSSKYVFVLPSEANDKSLAMTGSYSGMLMAGLLIARIKEIESLAFQVKVLIQYGHKLLSQSEMFRQIAEMNFNRAVFLGSGPLFGTATESQLKLQELTDGRIICKNDSFLGFRHGPKVVIDQKTLVFLLFSNQNNVICYENDFIESLNDGQKPLLIVGLAESGELISKLDKLFVLSDKGIQLDEEFLPICFILPAQMIGFFKSIQLGLNPDRPSVSGAISRVVKGVVIYPRKNKQK